ncbi:MAG TPA: D-alanine--D-alanine ligase family protein [Pelolinea sp.]|nr:D-alanine--D-alanine ligase family protein [Pelolinea sp.]
MAGKIRLGIILGGRSGEHEVSLMSSRSVLSVLDPEKYTVTQIGIDHEGRWWSGDDVITKFENGSSENLYRVFLLPEPGPVRLYRLGDGMGEENAAAAVELDVLFPVLHGTFCEDGTIQGFFEMADVAYVGAGVVGSSVGMDKGVFKDVMRANGIPVVDWLVCSRKEVEADMDRLIRQTEQLFPYPVFIKPANLGSSVGITKAKNRSDLLEGIMEAARYDRRVLIEKGLNAREIEVSVLGNENPRASVPGEIVPSDEFYSYKAKYIDGKSGLFIPAPISDELIAQVKDLAIKTYKAIDCAGMARVDFLLDKDTQSLYMNEVNTIPGFTSISMYPKLWEASGLPYAELVDELIQLALERKTERNKSKRIFGD